MYIVYGIWPYLILGYFVEHYYFSWYLFLFSWTPFREVCANYEVVMFQTWAGTPLDLGSVTNCCVAVLINPYPPLSALHQMSTRGGLTSCAHSISPFPTVVSPRRIIIPPVRHLSPSHHTKAHHSLHHTPLPPPGTSLFICVQT